jgi:glycosyltransferase involved in cell wall biosynthesis
VSVVLPCRNEGPNLRIVLPRLPSWIDEVVVVDSGSTDDTVAVARSLLPTARIVTAPAPGKGAALIAGVGAATSDYVIAMDADGSNDPAELDRMIEQLDAGADLVKGSRYLPGGGSDDATRARDLGNVVLRWTFNRIHGAELTDLCYGYVGFRRPHGEVLFAGCEGFDVEAVLQANACGAGLRVAEVPSHEARRVHGASNLRPVRDGARILAAIVRTRPGARRAPVAAA